MIAAESFPVRPKLDDPWRRLPWLTPAAALLWAMLLLGFTLLLRDSGHPTETITRLDARLIDVPAAAPAGLQGEPQQESQPVAAPPPPVAAPQPRVEKKPAAIPRVKKKQEGPPPVYDARGARTLPAEAVGAAGEPAPQGPPPDGRGVGGLGTDSIGARALYAPPPQIPDDLRENVFETVAVAHLHVGFDGDAKVALTQSTSNPRLNVLLLDTLKQWRFFPAIRNGIAVDSDFDVRIPIAVR
ncbi:MAG: hypothetical protein ACHQ9S_26425 [Candidatus Binatia bacterium]